MLSLSKHGGRRPRKTAAIDHKYFYHWLYFRLPRPGARAQNLLDSAYRNTNLLR